jgi:hypothetical protein
MSSEKRCYFCGRTEEEILKIDGNKILDKENILESDGDYHKLLPVVCNFCYNVFEHKLKENIILFRCSECNSWVSPMGMNQSMFPYPKWACMTCGTNFEMHVIKNEIVRAGDEKYIRGTGKGRLKRN